LPTDRDLPELLEKVDWDLAQKAKAAGCHCGDKLYCDNYPRKPRGGPEHWDKRLSFTCAEKRHRVTPPSVRFLGRKVYVATVVVLVSAMRNGLSAQRVQALRERLGIDRRTLERWRVWWLENFVQSSFWKAARARFMPPVGEKTLPLSLCEAFEIEQGNEIERRDRLLDLLKFLCPLTTSWHPAGQGF
jgi:hypothetical protein